MRRMRALVHSTRIPWVIATILVGAVLTIWVFPATAQKSKKPQPVHTSQASIRDVLDQYQGKATNLGMLTKVTGDYFALEDEGVTTIHPFTAIHSLVITKDEEAATTKLEIKLIAKE